MWAKQSPSTSSADPGVEAEVGAGETTTGGTDSVWSGNFKLNQY